MERLKVRWKEAWKASPHYAKYQYIDTDFPFNRFWKISDTLSRLQASLLTQVRIGHILLNSYLFCIKKSGTSRCEACWGIGQVVITETVVHYLFECQV